MSCRKSDCLFILLVTAVNCTPDRSVPDVIPPTVISVIPDSGATNVSLGVKPTIVFSEPINPDSLISSTFIVVTSIGGHTGPINGSVNCYGDTLVFTPVSKLWPNLRYTALIDKNIMDMSGNRIASYYSWSFFTEPSEDKTPPEFISVSPAPGSTGVGLDAKIVLVFNEKIRPWTVNSSSFEVRYSGLTIAGRIDGKISLTDSIAVFEPNYKLSPKRSYEVRVGTAIMDIAGNNLTTGFTWHFHTIETPKN